MQVNLKIFRGINFQRIVIIINEYGKNELTDEEAER